jgi:guanylate kinase
VGESGTGKSMLANRMHDEYGIPLLYSYTDRAPRYDGEEGHLFVTREYMDELFSGETLAQTTFGENRYCCIPEDVEQINTYVIDEVGVESLKKNWLEHYDIYTVRIHREEKARLISVGSDRCMRDEGRYNMPDEDFDCVIKNYSDSPRIFYGAIDMFLKKNRLINRVKPYNYNETENY